MSDQTGYSGGTPVSVSAAGSSRHIERSPFDGDISTARPKSHAEGAVYNAMCRVSEEMEMLGASINGLEKQLNPVLAGENPPANAENKEMNVQMSPLHGELLTYARRLVNIRRHIDSLTERVTL